MRANATIPLAPLLGFRSFSDGTVRPVYLEVSTGRQYVPDNQGEPMYGLWLRKTEPDTLEVAGSNEVRHQGGDEGEGERESLRPQQ
jgi:hypothetical protein